MNRKIYFVRHGSPIRIKDEFIGRIDSPLTIEGKKEAMKTGMWLKNQGFLGQVYSSPLSRAYDTAQIIVNEIKKDKIEIVEDLIECDFGLFDGLSINEFKNKYPKEFLLWYHNPFVNNFPNGESFLECGKRFAKAIDEILEKNKNNNEDILIVAHMCAIQSYFIVKEIKTFGIDFVEKAISCASITEVLYNDKNELKIEKWGFVPQ